MKTEYFSYDPKLWDRWKTGKLAKELKKKYPKLFDDKDLQLTVSQPSWHFIEWLGAIHYYRQGFNVLVEQYIYNPHPRKQQIVKKFVGEDGFRFLRREDKRKKTQPPDLFVYKGKEFFFAEVKRTDKLSPAQKNFFKQIEKRFKKQMIKKQVVLLQAKVCEGLVVLKN